MRTRALNTSPMIPSLIRSQARTVAGRQRKGQLTISVMPADSEAFTMRSAPASVAASGFSTIT